MEPTKKPNTTKVTSAQLLKQFGRYHDAALQAPVTVTKHGRDSVVLVSVVEYLRLKRRDRDVLRVDDLDVEFLHALEKTEVSPEHAHLDDELKDEDL